MRPFWKYILITVFTLIILGYMVYSLWYFGGSNQDHVCRRLEIVLTDSSSIRLINQNDIAVILEQANLNPMGKTIRRIRTESIEEVLSQNPMVKKVECYKTPSGIVNIRVQQRCPKFRVVGTESYYVDYDRKTLPVSLNYAVYVPVVSGRITKSLATGAMFDFVSLLEKNPFWNAQIEQIYVRDDLKVELVPRVGDAVILLGTLTDYEAKLEKLRKLYVYGFNTIGWNRYKIIDLQYKNQVVCDKQGSQPVQMPLVQEIKKDSIITDRL